MLKRDEDSVLRFTRDLEVSGKKKGRTNKKDWRKQVEEETEKVNWVKDRGYALNRAMQRNGMQRIAEGMR